MVNQSGKLPFLVKALILYILMLLTFHFLIDLGWTNAALEALVLPAAYLVFNIIIRLGDRKQT